MARSAARRGGRSRAGRRASRNEGQARPGRGRVAHRGQANGRGRRRRAGRLWAINRVIARLPDCVGREGARVRGRELRFAAGCAGLAEGGWLSTWPDVRRGTRDAGRWTLAAGCGLLDACAACTGPYWAILCGTVLRARYRRNCRRAGGRAAGGEAIEPGRILRTAANRSAAQWQMEATCGRNRATGADRQRQWHDNSVKPPRPPSSSANLPRARRCVRALLRARCGGRPSLSLSLSLGTRGPGLGSHFGVWVPKHASWAHVSPGWLSEIITDPPACKASVSLSARHSTIPFPPRSHCPPP